jgi:CelD/BcsL family acetyltransferase involved in cellulose biosynthesis
MEHRDIASTLTETPSVLSYLQALLFASPAKWRVSIAATPEAMRSRWPAIQAAGGHTVFQTPEWLEAWYGAAARCPGVEPVIVMVDDADGLCAMVLPLIVALSGGRRVLGFADQGVTDYNAPLLGPAAPRTPAAMRQIWTAIRRELPQFDLIRFDKMPRMAGRVENPMVWLSGAGLSSQTQSACRIGLPYQASREALMPASFRSKMDACLKRLKKNATMRFYEAAGLAEVTAAFDALVAQKSARARQMGWHDNVLDDPVWQDFYRGLAIRGALGQGPARLLVLSVDDAPAAIILGFLQGDRFHDVVASFDTTRFKNCSLGLLVQDMAMGFMAERGVTTYDMTIGAESYKDLYGPEVETLYEYAATGSLRGFSGAAVTQAKLALRRSPAMVCFAKRCAAFFQSAKSRPA